MSQTFPEWATISLFCEDLLAHSGKVRSVMRNNTQGIGESCGCGRIIEYRVSNKKYSTHDTRYCHNPRRPDHDLTHPHRLYGHAGLCRALPARLAHPGRGPELAGCGRGHPAGSAIGPGQKGDGQPGEGLCRGGGSTHPATPQLSPSAGGRGGIGRIGPGPDRGGGLWPDFAPGGAGLAHLWLRECPCQSAAGVPGGVPHQRRHFERG